MFTKRGDLAVALLLLLLILPWADSDAAVLAPGEGYLTTTDNIRLFYKVVGKGPGALVVVHGGPGNTMFSILPDFAPLAENRFVIYYDQRGNGRSQLTTDPGLLAIANHVADLEALRLHFNLEKLSLLGNSWGGLLASYYAIAHPERVERLILHSPASPSYDMLRDSTPFIYQRIPARDLARFQSLSVPEIWRTARKPVELCRKFYELLLPVYFSNLERAKDMKGDVCAGPPEAVRLQSTVNKIIWESLGEWDLLEELRTVRVPTLVIHGSYDMIPLDSSIAWARALPNARLLVMEDSGHMTHIERPDLFFPAVESFLSGTWPAGAIRIPGREERIRPPLEIIRP
ncbi:MAG: alpha/beta fold hydrolase [Desulfobulbaceae bacterium]